MACKVRDEITARYVSAVQDVESARIGTFSKAEAAEAQLVVIRNELVQHDSLCWCSVLQRKTKLQPI
jgi:hypothetical protein